MRVIADKSEGVGLILPERNPAHANPNWYQLDTDDAYDDPDEAFVDPLPTARHRAIPD